MALWVRIVFLLSIPAVVSSLLSYKAPSTLPLTSFRRVSTKTNSWQQLSSFKLIHQTATAVTPLQCPKRSTYGSSSSSLGTAPLLISDYTGPAVKFFQSLRVPSALIAGSSLTAFFLKLNDKKQRPTKLYYTVLYLYYLLSSLALMLSLNVIVTSTAASNTLLVGADYHHVTKKAIVATSMLDFLRQKGIVYQFIVTRWSFYMAMLSFMQAITCRTLIVFDFLRKENRKCALLVIVAMTSFLSHILHLLNDCVYVYPNLLAMTIGLFKVNKLSFERREVVFVWPQRERSVNFGVPKEVWRNLCVCIN